MTLKDRNILNHLIVDDFHFKFDSLSLNVLISNR